MWYSKSEDQIITEDVSDSNKVKEAWKQETKSEVCLRWLIGHGPCGFSSRKEYEI